jgi:predicted nucleic acid-binding protein
MSEVDYPPIEANEIFLDTSVLYDYTKDAVPEAESLFEEYTDVVKATCKAAESEYRKVAKRRVDAIDLCEDFAVENPLQDFSFHSLEFLTDNDRGALRNYRDSLLRDYSEVEALRRLNERKRTYQRGVELLFDARDPLITVRDTEFRQSLDERFQLDINNGNDREILCHAAEWHNRGFGNTFTTSDADDFGEEGELGGYLATDGGELPDSLDDLEQPPLIDRLNESIQAEYTSSTWLHVVGINRFLKAVE